MLLEKGIQASPLYQMLEFCREAAVVRLFHVHHFRVCAQNVKFPGSESQEENRPQRWLSNRGQSQIKQINRKPWGWTHPLRAATSPESLLRIQTGVNKTGPVSLKSLLWLSIMYSAGKNHCSPENLCKRFNYILYVNYDNPVQAYPTSISPSQKTLVSAQVWHDLRCLNPTGKELQHRPDLFSVASTEHEQGSMWPYFYCSSEGNLTSQWQLWWQGRHTEDAGSWMT